MGQFFLSNKSLWFLSLSHWMVPLPNYMIDISLMLQMDGFYIYRLNCPIVWTCWWGFVVCFSDFLWPGSVLFCHSHHAFFLHQIEANFCLIHLWHLSSVLGLVPMCLGSTIVAARIHRASPHLMGFCLHSPLAIAVDRERRQSLAMSLFGWWQPGSQLFNRKPPSDQFNLRFF
jgi:hypothetical protein